MAVDDGSFGCQQRLDPQQPLQLQPRPHPGWLSERSAPGRVAESRRQLLSKYLLPGLSAAGGHNRAALVGWRLACSAALRPNHGNTWRPAGRPTQTLKERKTSLTQVNRHVQARQAAQAPAPQRIPQAQEGRDGSIVLGDAPQRRLAALRKGRLAGEPGWDTCLVAPVLQQSPRLPRTCGRLRWKASSCSACARLGAAGFSLSTCLPASGRVNDAWEWVCCGCCISSTASPQRAHPHAAQPE